MSPNTNNVRPMLPKNQPMSCTWWQGLEIDSCSDQLVDWYCISVLYTLCPGRSFSLLTTHPLAGDGATSLSYSVHTRLLTGSFPTEQPGGHVQQIHANWSHQIVLLRCLCSLYSAILRRSLSASELPGKEKGTPTTGTSNLYFQIALDW